MIIGIDCRLWNETGIGRYIRNLVVELSKQDKKNDYVLFVLLKDRTKIENKKLGDHFKCVTADIRWHSIEEQLLLPEILRRENLDLMHFPYFSVPIFYNKPFVVTIHDLIIDHYPTGEATTLYPFIYQAKRFGYRYIIQTAAKKAKKVITVSHATEKEIIDHLHIQKDKIAVTYEGVGDKLKATNHIEKMNNKNIFLHVGNVYPHKNILRLLVAFHIVVKNNPDTQLIFVGKDDFFFQKLRTKVKKEGLEKSIIFTGLITDEALATYYQQSIAIVVPSLMEGFGLPAVEAMAQDCLVLASNIPSLREICGNAAMYFDPLDASNIAKCMEEAVQLPITKRKELIHDGKKKILQYSWQKMAEETLLIYERCIGV